MNDDKCYSVYADEGWGDFYSAIDGLEVGDHYYEGTRVMEMVGKAAAKMMVEEDK